jgi:hypothetical protein
MDENIARLNIANFRAKLVAEQDEKTRRTLHRLLTEEEVKLAMLEDQSRHGNRKVGSNAHG